MSKQVAQKPPVLKNKTEITKEFLPVVKRIAYSFARKSPSSISVDDLIGAGLLGLADASNRYDPERAEQFRSFAEARIRGAIIDELRSQGPLSRDLRAKSNDLAKTISHLERKLGRQPFENEITDELDMTPDEYHSLLMSLQHATVLSPTIIEHAVDRPRGYPDRVPGNPQDDVLYAELRGRLASAISKLPEREQRMLAMYYQDELSLKEIGEKFGVTESRACQVRSESIHRLRSILEKEE